MAPSGLVKVKFPGTPWRAFPFEAASEVGVVAFRLVHARYDRKTRRAYVELRDADDDGGEILASAIFSFRSSTTLTDRQIQQEIVRKARYVMKRAAAAA